MENRSGVRAAARSFVSRRFELSESPLPLALFRIAFALVMLVECGLLLRNADFFFEQHGTRYLTTSFYPLLLVWFVSLLLLLVGWCTRYASVVSYVCTMHILSTFGIFEYHWDYPAIGVALLMVVVPTHRALSVDGLFARRRGAPLPEFSAPIHREIFLVVGLGLVYIDSVFFKLDSPMWISGLGVWLPASLPQIRWTGISWILEFEWFMRFVGYLTIAFEASFLFVLWWRRAWFVLFLVGVGLHLGILLFFPIPLFAVGSLAFYLLLVPANVYRGIARSRIPGAAEEEMREDLGASGNHPVRLRLGEQLVLTTVLCLICTFQFLMAMDQMAKAIGRWSGVQFPQIQVHPPGATEFLGLVPHPVFVDFHFEGYEVVYSLRRIGLPGTSTAPWFHDERGLAVHGNHGRIWVWWGFRVNRPVIGRSGGVEAFLDSVTIWVDHLRAKGELPEGVELEVVSRSVEVPDEWVRGHLRRQMERPWEPLFRVRFDSSGWQRVD